MILLIGDDMIDHNIFVDCNRVSPEAPCLIGDYNSYKMGFGGAGNVKHNLEGLNLF